MVIIPPHASPPPPPPSIVQECAYQIEVNDIGTRAYKCITVEEHQAIINQHEKERIDSDIWFSAHKWWFIGGGVLLFAVLAYLG